MVPFDFGNGLFFSFSVLTTTYFIAHEVDSLYCVCLNVEFPLLPNKTRIEKLAWGRQASPTVALINDYSLSFVPFEMGVQLK